MHVKPTGSDTGAVTGAAALYNELQRYIWEVSHCGCEQFNFDDNGLTF